MPILDEPPIRRFTRAEYHAMANAGLFEQERVELVHGVVRRMSPMHSPHSYAVRRLNTLVVPQVAGRAEVLVQMPVAASDTSEPEPDFALVPPGDYLDDHPHTCLLVVEVAQSSLRYDRSVKGPLHAAMGVPEYWIVNLVDEVVEVHRALSEGAYCQVTVARRGEVLEVQALPSVTVPVAALLRPTA